MEGRRRDCYDQDLNGNFLNGEKFCQVIFDGVLCWSATRAGQIVEQACPNQQLSDSSISFSTSLNKKALKACDVNGDWFVHPGNNQTWTDYTQCNMTYFNNETGIISWDRDNEIDKDFREMYLTWWPIMKEISYDGYWISIITLLFCVLILVSIKKLHCARNILHVHLFMSFIMRAVAFLVKEAIFVNGVAMQSDLVTDSHGNVFITENFNWICKATTSTWFYFIQANYMFILMEGIYLHNLMFLNLFSEKSSVRIYYIFGWGIPLIFIPLWAALRTMYDNLMCWTLPNNKYIPWLVKMPIGFSVIVNFILFLSITRILCIKIKSMYVQHNRVKYRRLIRSTLTLLLIYAVPYAISEVVHVAVSYYKENSLELIWLCCDQIFTAFQGLLMGLIYCLLNSEVQSELKRIAYSLRNYRANNVRTLASRTISNTMQFTIPIQIHEFESRRFANNANGNNSHNGTNN